MITLLLLAFMFVWPWETAVAVQPPPGQQAFSDERSAAYYEFLLGRYLEGRGDRAAAIAAQKRAAELDPASAEVQAELAGLFIRENRIADAIAAAQAGLRIDSANQEANRVLGSIYAAYAEGRAVPEDGRADADAQKEYAAKAIEHLERVVDPQRYDPGLALSLAQLYVQTGAYPKAIPLLTALVAGEPDAYEARLLLGQAYAGSGRMAEAIDTLERTTGEMPEFFRGLTFLAELYERADRWSDAAATYARAQALDPQNLELKIRRASALRSANRSAEARDLLKEVLKAQPSDASALFMLSDIQSDLNDLDAAEATARRLMEVEPNQVRGPYALALTFERRREYDRVVETLEAAVEKARQRNAAGRQVRLLLVHLGFAYQELADHDRAIAAFEQARSAAEPESAVEVYLVQAYVAARRYAMAVELARQALSRYPDDDRLSRLEAQALVRSGQIEKGLSLLEERLRANPDDPAAYLAVASVCVDAKRLDLAVERLDQATRKFPDNLDLAFQLGATFEQQERYGEAEAQFRKLLARDPNHAATLNYLGYMLADRGERLDESVDLIKRALKEDPFNGSYLDSLGWAYFKQGRLELAEEPLATAAKQLPQNSVVHDHLGDLMFRLGHHEKAIDAWERALAGDGESIEPQAIEKKIKEARAKSQRQ